MNSVTINGRRYNVPASWEELRQGQAQSILKYAIRDFKPEQLLYAVLLIVLDVRSSLHLKWLFFTKMNKEILGQLAPLTDFVFKGLNLCMNYYPVIKCGGKKMYGPSSYLLNASFIEFIEADNAFVNAITTKKDEYFDTLIGILYREKKNFIERFFEKFDLFGREFTTDNRKKFNSDSLPSRVLAVKQLDEDIKKAIIDYFNDSRLFIINHKNHEHLFVQAENKSDKSSGGWYRVLDSTAGKAYGDFNSTAHTNVYTVFNHLNNLMEQQKEAERKAKRS